MLKIWGRHTSSNVQKVMWAVGELGIEYERADVGGMYGGLDTQAFAALNPNRRIPVIEDEGTLVWESNAIVRYLCERYAHCTLHPTNPATRARADQWMDWLYNAAYPNLIKAFLGLYRVAEADRDNDAISKALHICAKELRVLDAHLANRNFVMGDAITMGDIPVGCVTYRWYAMNIDRPELPHLAAWYARLQERPAYREHAMIPLQ